MTFFETPSLIYVALCDCLFRALFSCAPETVGCMQLSPDPDICRSVCGRYSWLKNGKPFQWQVYDTRMLQQPDRGTLVITSPQDVDIGEKGRSHPPAALGQRSSTPGSDEEYVRAIPGPYQEVDRSLIVIGKATLSRPCNRGVSWFIPVQSCF